MPVLLDHKATSEQVKSAAAISDEELAALALAADPDAEVEADAVPWVDGSVERSELLPDFYMPAPVTGARTPWQRAMGLTFVGALILVNVSGLCVTYGVLELA